MHKTIISGDLLLSYLTLKQVILGLAEIGQSVRQFPIEQKAFVLFHILICNIILFSI